MIDYLKRYWHWAVLTPIFMIGEVAADLVQPKMMKIIVDDGVLGLSGSGDNFEIIIKTGLIMIAIVVLGGFAGVMSGVFGNLCSQNFGNDIRKDCFKRTMEFSFAQTDRFSTGSIVTRITNDITQLQNMVLQCLRGFVRTGLLIVGGIFCLLTLDLSFGAVALCALPFILGLVIYFILKANPIFEVLQTKLDKLNGVVQENVAGARVVKAYVREEYENDRFKKANNELVGTQLKVLELFSYMSPLMNIFLNGAIVAVIWVGGIRVEGAGVTPGAVMAAVTYITQILNAVMRTSMIFQTVSRGAASAARLKEVLNCEPELKDGDFNGETDVKGKVEFKNVSFGYGGKDILKDISFVVESGETLGILGETGCGKTSLVNLIPRFYDVKKGSVLVDGVDVRDYKLRDLRGRVSVALQKSELFNKTIKENIRWGDMEADDLEIERAAEIAQAKEFIERKAEGFDSMVAEKGMSLSGGQKQRLAISRSILKKGEILIFDDCTSALDLKTEAELFRELNNEFKGLTKIIVAQRIASVKGADKLIVIDKGRIAACGSHEELMKDSEIYRDIYYSQMKEE